MAAPSHGAQSGPAWTTGKPDKGSDGSSGGAAGRQAMPNAIDPKATKQ